MPTIAETSTPQEVFDFVVNHLYKQGRPALHNITNHGGDGSVKCAYRSQDGLTCAVGCLLTDEEYKPDMEYRGIWRLAHYGQLVAVAGGFYNRHASLLQKLQLVHDGNGSDEFNRDYLNHRLNLVAGHYNLTFKEPEHATTQ